MTDMDKAIEEARVAVLPANLRFDESWERLPGESGLLLIAAQTASLRRFLRLSGLRA
jgi:hypothetical protein